MEMMENPSSSFWPCFFAHKSLPMSKHQKRRERRQKYFAMLDAELPNELAFVERVINTLDDQGLDCGSDGETIKADFHRYIKQRKKTDPTASLACLDLLERAKRKISIKPIRRSSR